MPLSRHARRFLPLLLLAMATAVASATLEAPVVAVASVGSGAPTATRENSEALTAAPATPEASAAARASSHEPGSARRAPGLRFEISFPSDYSRGPLTGRMFLILARDDDREPRLQVGRYGPPLFGVDFEDLRPGEPVVVDATTLGWPWESLADAPAGEYRVQAVLNRYTRFERSDGHVVWMHQDQWEGQDWRRSPGNATSRPETLHLDPSADVTHRLSVDQVIPPVEVPADTEWVKRFKIQSAILTEFWGQPMYLGATVLLPPGYEDDPEARFPTIYHQGHFSLAPPLRFERDEDFTEAWESGRLPRFVAVTLQHPNPYFDDSYAVNSANVGPYGDAIHQELIPEIERRFRVIPKGWARLLTGGSTGGWEAFALQVFHPDFYGGTWAFAPDPLDFRNVEGIDIYADNNAFYKDKEWYRVPIVNTRDAETETAILTSRQRNRMELVHGTRGRSGQQLDIWSAVFGPVGEDGYFAPLFDKRTGEIDPEVAAYWRDHYDLRHYLEENWSRVGPSLAGKLRVICGRLDHFFLNQGVYYMEAFLESTRDPHYGGSFTYGPRGGHGWRPYGNAELVRRMADHLDATAPAGAVRAWRR